MSTLQRGRGHGLGEALPVEKRQEPGGEEKVDHRREKKVPEEGEEGVSPPPFEGNQKVLGISKRAHDAPYGHTEGQGQQKGFGGDSAPATEPQDPGRGDHRHRIVHQKSGEKTETHSQEEEEEERSTPSW